MKDQTFYSATAAIASLVIVASFLAGAYGGNLSAAGPGGTSTGSTAGPVYVYLSINANPDLSPGAGDQYEPANFTVPSHTWLVFVITNYDPGENPVSAAFAHVSGTLGDVEYLNGSRLGTSSVLPEVVSHTFSFTLGPYEGFNVPIPAAGSSSPTVVQFSVYFNTTGQFTWNCLAPCDPASMQTPGFMTGTMTVTS